VGKSVAVLGAGYSAMGTTLDLAKLRETEPNTETIWTLRSDNPEKSFGGGTNDKLGRLFAQLVRSVSVRVEKDSAGCCGGPAPADADPCCQQDADAKATGSKGCSCS